MSIHRKYHSALYIVEILMLPENMFGIFSFLVYQRYDDELTSSSFQTTLVIFSDDRNSESHTPSLLETKSRKHL